MSDDNIEIVRSIYADPGGLTAGASGRVAPDAEFDLSEAYPDAPILRGLEAFRRFRDSGPWSGSRIHFQPERFLSIGDQRVLAFVRVAATGRESGVPVEMPVAHEFTIRDNLVVRFKVYRSRDQALEAVGLSE
jgi:ketosteroid isomerase-like protein